MGDIKARVVGLLLGGLGAFSLLLISCAPVEPMATATRLLPTPTPASHPRAVPSQAAELAQTRAEEAPTPERAQVESDSGELIRTSYPSLLIDGQVPLIIYLPPGHDPSLASVPVIYLLHGATYDERQWIDLGMVAYAEEAILKGGMPPLAMVMPYQPEPLFSSSDGGRGSYEAELTERVLPYVESRFNLGAPRALAGISRGAVWALEIAFRHPEDFEGVAALSPALHLNFARPRYDPFWLAEQKGPLPARIYLTAGVREPAFRQSMEELAGVLERVGAEHRLVIGSGGHDNEFWAEVARSALDYLAEGLSTVQSRP